MILSYRDIDDLSHYKSGGHFFPVAMVFNMTTLTENPSALWRWMVCGPEMAHSIGEFETTDLERHECDSHHHEQRKHIQLASAQNVKSLTEILEDMGYPFTGDSSDLLVLDSRNIM